MVFTGNHAAGNNPIAGGLFFGAGQSATMTELRGDGNSSASVGGAILVATGASLTITDSTVSNNSAGGAGGGIFVNHYGSLTLTNCTISGNTAARAGAASTPGASRRCPRRERPSPETRPPATGAGSS